MMGFFSMFKKSAEELRSVRCVVVTGFLVAVSMVIEGFSIDFSWFKINFAFLAIASIGMLFGPSVSLIAGCACDIVGYIAKPGQAFLPIYILAAGLQGLIYGICLYRKNDGVSIKLANNKTRSERDITLFVRAIFARLLDVVFINLIINTKLNLHYGFIPEQAYGAAVVARVSKNVIELVVDIPLLFMLLPVVLIAYKRSGADRKIS